MTRRSGKPGAQTTDPVVDLRADTSSHFAPHLHLTNCIHIHNHVHKRPSHLQLMKELTALQKASSLHDPATTPLVVSTTPELSLRVPRDCEARREKLGKTRKDSRDGLRRASEPTSAVKGNTRDTRSSKEADGKRMQNLAAEKWDEEAQIGAARMHTNSALTGATGKRSKDMGKVESPSLREGWTRDDNSTADAAAIRTATHELVKRLISENSSNAHLQEMLSNAAHLQQAMDSNAAYPQGEEDGFQSDPASESLFQAEEDEELSHTADVRETRSAATAHVSSSSRHLQDKNSESSPSLLLLRTHPSRAQSRRSRKIDRRTSLEEAMQSKVAEMNSHGSNDFTTEGHHNFASEPESTVSSVAAAAAHEVWSRHSTRADRRDGTRGKKKEQWTKAADVQQMLPKENSKINIQITRAEEDNRNKVNRTLSQKYRPKHFNELVGQSMVVMSLTMAIAKDRIAPVYLFTGPQGTGKTTVARIFARALNCLASDSEARPCGICQNCGATVKSSSSGILDGSDADVMEINAANDSNNNSFYKALDDLKSMKKSMKKFSSSSSSSLLSHGHQRRCYKVFIVEGCNLLSTQVWNAFLKFLEEELVALAYENYNVVFILIPTESDQIPLTVISRCQRFSFCKIKESDIIKRLQWLAVKESLAVDEDAFSVIASRADGSLRDAEMLLDQLSLLDMTISSDMVRELAGLIPENKLLDLLDFALSANTVYTVRGMRQLLDLGVDALSLATQLATLITDLLAGSTFDTQQHREIHEDSFFKRNFSRQEELRHLCQALKILSEAEKQLRVSGDQPTWLIAALLQFAPDRSFQPSSSSPLNSSITHNSPVSFEAVAKEPTVAGKSIGQSMESQAPPLDRIHPLDRINPSDRIHPLDRIQAAAAEEDDLKVHRTAEVSSEKIVHQHKRRSNQQYWERVDMQANGASNVSKFSSKHVYSGGFRRLRRQGLKNVWNRVLQFIHSGTLRKFLHTHANLHALSIANDETHAIAKLEFWQLEHKAKAERLRSRICHAFQRVLNCPVELRINLAKFNNSKLLPSSSSSGAKHVKLLKAMAVQPGNLTTGGVKERALTTTSGERRRSFGIKHGTEWQGSKEEASQNGDDRVANFMKQQRKRRQLQKLEANQKLHRKSISQNAMNLDRVIISLTSSRAGKWNSRRLEPRRRSILCWKRTTPTNKQKGKSQHRRSQGKSFFLRLVPCIRSKLRTQTL